MSQDVTEIRALEGEKRLLDLEVIVENHYYLYDFIEFF